VISLSGARRVPGGDINDAYEVTLGDGRRAFVKTRADALPGEYRTEAAGLRWLGEPGALPVPEVLEATDEHLALAWVEEGAGYDAEELGRGLAAIHLAGAEAFGGLPPGAPGPLRIGPLELGWGPAMAPSGHPRSASPRPSAAAELSGDAPPRHTGDWPTFYAERLLAPLVPRAGLAAAGRRAVEAVCERMADLAGPPEPPARLHGDLWGGNVLAGANGRPWLVDPAAYGGHREVDLAMLRLFGSPGPAFLEAYEEVAPLAPGHEDRVALYQLLPLLVHAVLFGGGYTASVEAAARRYAG
jgi:fructosamine-3-kinase